MLFLFSGMVAQCAGCNLYEPWAALLVGLMAGLVFIGLHDLMLFMKLDDPLDAVAVHMGGNLREECNQFQEKYFEIMTQIETVLLQIP